MTEKSGGSSSSEPDRPRTSPGALGLLYGDAARGPAGQRRPKPPPSPLEKARRLADAVARFTLADAWRPNAPVIESPKLQGLARELGFEVEYLADIHPGGSVCCLISGKTEFSFLISEDYLGDPHSRYIRLWQPAGVWTAPFVS